MRIVLAAAVFIAVMAVDLRPVRAYGEAPVVRGGHRSAGGSWRDCQLSLGRGMPAECDRRQSRLLQPEPALGGLEAGAGKPRPQTPRQAGINGFETAVVAIAPTFWL